MPPSKWIPSASPEDPDQRSSGSDEVPAVQNIGASRHFDAVWLLPAFHRSLDALCRHQPKVRAKVRRALDGLLVDVTSLRRKPLSGARRNVFRTKIDGEKRLIDEPLGPERKREVAALYVGHHDANEWGQAYDDDTLAKLAAAERHVAPTTSAPLATRRVAEAAAPTYDRRRTEPTGRPDGAPHMYGDVLSAREVERRGVPRELVPTVLATLDCVDLTTVGLDQETASKVENWYLSKLPSRPPILQVPAVDEPLPMRVTRAELPGFLRLPLKKLLATLTGEQRRLAERGTERLVVVRGAAGSGKTVVGVRRIEWWIRQRDLFDQRPILFTCYNRVLARAATQMIEDTLGQSLRSANVEVLTAFQLMSRLERDFETRPRPRRVGKQYLLPVVREVRQAVTVSQPLRRWSDEELLDEFLEVIYGRVITSETEYQKADRAGRGRARRVDATVRSDIWRLFLDFSKRCRNSGRAAWDQLPARMVTLLERSPVPTARYAGIVIDEVQDLAPSMIRAILALQKGDDRNILVLGDAAQNVYRCSFRWKHMGLRVAGGQVATLRKCFRSTRSIAGAAAPLAQRQLDRLEEDLTLPEPTGDKGPPVQIRLYASADAELESIAEEIALQIENGVPPSSIGVLLDDANARRQLRELLSLLDCRWESYVKPGGAKYIDIHEPSVKLLTTGSAKGIEFQLLFIPMVTQRRYPSTDEDGESADRARRVLYTAMMRCAYELHLSGTIGDASRLLDELDAAHVDRQGVVGGRASK